MTFMWGKKYVGKTSISLKKHFHSTPFQFLNCSFNQKFCAVPVSDLPVGSKHRDWNCLEPLHTKPGLRLQLDTAVHSPVRQVLPAARLLGSVWLSRWISPMERQWHPMPPNPQLSWCFPDSSPQRDDFIWPLWARFHQLQGSLKELDWLALQLIHRKGIAGVGSSLLRATCPMLTEPLTGREGKCSWLPMASNMRGQVIARTSAVKKPLQ